jgi:superoxide dismutase
VGLKRADDSEMPEKLFSYISKTFGGADEKKELFKER